MFCSNCGKELKDTEKFCTNCGTKIERNEKEVSSVERKFSEEKSSSNEKVITVEVKRPFMKAVAMVTIPLTICLALIVMLFYFCFFVDTFEARSFTDEEWKKVSIEGPILDGGTGYNKYYGIESYEEWKDEVWEKQYDEIPISVIIVLTIVFGLIGIASEVCYKNAQKEEYRWIQQTLKQ